MKEWGNTDAHIAQQGHHQGCAFKYVNCERDIRGDIMGIPVNFTPEWIPQDPLDDGKSTLVKVMAGCLTAPSHYLDQCWSRSTMPCSVIWLQWVKTYVFQKIPWTLEAVRFGNLIFKSCRRTIIDCGTVKSSVKYQSDMNIHTHIYIYIYIYISYYESLSLSSVFQL